MPCFGVNGKLRHNWMALVRLAPATVQTTVVKDVDGGSEVGRWVRWGQGADA